MRLVERPGKKQGSQYVGEENAKYGIFTYPCQRGGLLILNESRNFGFSLGHPTGCFHSGETYFDLLLHRNTLKTDNKGIYEPLRDYKVAYHRASFYIEHENLKFQTLKQNID